MADVFNSGLFGRNAGELFERQIFTQSDTERGMLIANEGVAGTQSFTHTAEALGERKQYYGMQVSLTAFNMSGATRNVTIIITNTTTSKVLFSDNFDLAGSAGNKTLSIFYGDSEINETDGVSIDFGNEGIGTGVGAVAFDYYEVEFKTVWRREKG